MLVAAISSTQISMTRQASLQSTALPNRTALKDVRLSLPLFRDNFSLVLPESVVIAAGKKKKYLDSLVPLTSSS